MNKRLVVAIIMGLLLLLAVPLVQAGDCGCPEVPPVKSVDIEFACDKLTVTWSHSEGTESGIIIVNGDTFDLIVLEFFEGSSGSYTITFDPPLAKTTNLFIDIGIFADEELIAESMLMVNCSDVPTNLDDSLPDCTDGRLTYTLCQPLVVYPVISDDGVGMTIYLVSRGSDVGQFMLYIPAETFEALPDQVPANCTIDSSEDGRVVVYRLTSGEYQVSVGPDEEGKVFAYIFTDLTSAPVRIDSVISGLKPEILPACI